MNSPSKHWTESQRIAFYTKRYRAPANIEVTAESLARGEKRRAIEGIDEDRHLADVFGEVWD